MHHYIGRRKGRLIDILLITKQMARKCLTIYNMNKAGFILLFAAAALAVSCGQTEKKGTGMPVTTDVAQSSMSAASGSIVYIQMDSLVSKYKMFKDLNGAFVEKQKKVEAELTTKGRSLENEMRAAQEKVDKGLVTRAQAAELEQTIQQKGQGVMQYRDNILRELAEEEQVMLNNIQYNIMEYLKEYNADKKYSMIISSSGSNPVLIADPAFDITIEVLDALNKKYEATKTK